MKLVKVKAIKHEDVNGRALYYLQAFTTDEAGEINAKVTVNVGEGTYNKVKALQDGEPEPTKEDKSERPLSEKLADANAKRGRGNGGDNK